jgi:hypothetical protein
MLVAGIVTNANVPERDPGWPVRRELDYPVVRQPRDLVEQHRVIAVSTGKRQEMGTLPAETPITR